MKVEKTLANILVVGDPKKETIPVLQAASVHYFKTSILMAHSLKEAIKTILEKPVDAVVIEYHLPDGNAMQFLEALSHLSVRMIPTIILAGEEDEKIGIQAFRKGAKDFLIKDKSGHYLQRLPLAIERILKEESRFRENTRLKKNHEAILAAVSDGIIGLNLEGVITLANPVAAMYLHEPFETLFDKPFSEFSTRFGEEFVQALEMGMKQVASSNHPLIIGHYPITFGKEFTSTLEVSITPIFSELLRLEGYVLTLRDISESKGSLNDSSNDTTHDNLTGLLTKESFVNRLEHVMAYCNRYQTKCAVLFIDMDDFKTFSETEGVRVSDEMLIKISARIKSVLREADLLARIGGDKFLVLVNHLQNPTDASKVAIKINRALLPSFEIHSQKYHITASIGIAIFPTDSTDAEKLIQHADFAMGMVKKQGKNYYQFYKADMNVEAKKVMKLSNDLRQAIQGNQLELFFQPQIHSTTGVVVGLEALLRWKHPELGMIPPTLFIPIAEERGFIEDLGKWVLNKACEYCLQWQKEGLNKFTISINTSVKELRREEFLEDVAETVYRHQVDPKRFQFEITESIFAHDTDEVIQKLFQLKQIGFQIAMDDFGTGYSCLSYLKDLPIDVIKIDRSFVQSMGFQNYERHKAIIATIIDLAKRLNMTTLAEGVESKEQAQYLQSLGCDHLQGYLIAKPMPFNEATEFLRQRTDTKQWQQIKNQRN